MNRFEKLGYTKVESLMLYDMADAITQANRWAWLRAHPLEENATEFDEIDRFIEYKDHTPHTYDWCMRQLKLLAQHGFQGLANLRGVNIVWKDYVNQVEAVPDLHAQAEALRKFERGEISYAEMRTLCG